jgi:predicted SAM-dependent methyltransferase
MRIRFDRKALASVYLRGHGIEIGGLQSPLKVPWSAKVQYIDRMTVPELRRHYPELKSYKLVEADIIDDGETLGTIEDASQDFVIANHFLEHCENPIKAVTNFFRVLREGGILYLAIPDKRYTFDKKREVTSFDHLVRDYEKGPQASRKEHLEDWVINVEGQKDEIAIQKRIRELDEMNYSIHYHNWTQKEMFDLFRQLDKRFGLPIEILQFVKHEAEGVFIIEKQSDCLPQ